MSTQPTTMQTIKEFLVAFGKAALLIGIGIGLLMLVFYVVGLLMPPEVI